MSILVEWQVIEKSKAILMVNFALHMCSIT